MNLRLEELSEDHERSFLDLMDDYQKCDPRLFEQLYKRKATWTPQEFKKFVTECEKQRMDWRPKAGKTSLTRYVMLGEQNQIYANALLRFPLDAKTEIDGGNLFVDVAPSHRLKGFGSYCLALTLFEAVRAGLRRALVTCPEDHVIARRVIEKNRGLLQDVVLATSSAHANQLIARYWIHFS